MLSCSSLGIPRCSEKRRYIIPPAISGSTLGSPPSGLAQENLQRELPRRHPNQMTKPPQLTSFNTKEQWLSFELTLNVPAPHPVPVTLWRKLISDIFFLNKCPQIAASRFSRTFCFSLSYVIINVVFGF